MCGTLFSCLVITKKYLKELCHEILDLIFLLKRSFDMVPKNGFANFFVFAKIFSKAKTVKKKRRDAPLTAVCHDTIHEIMHEDLAGSLKKVCQMGS